MSLWIFWASVILVAYTYCGYALLVAMLARVYGTEPQIGTETPPLTIVIAAFNEAQHIVARVRNLLAQDYPASNLSVLVVSDGSTDDTERLAAGLDPRVRVLALRANGGKAVALNAALSEVKTDLVVFTDARQRFAPDTLCRLVAAFRDPRIGAVTGELLIEGRDGALPAVGLYWRMEKFLRSREAQLGWLHGVSGAVYALRTKLYRPLPAGTLLDDMWVPLHAAFAGYRIWMARDALAYDVSSAGSTEEYWRKLRTLAGNWQLLARLPRLLNPLQNRLFLAWFSHKLLRLIAPWLLIAAWVSAATIDGAFYQVAFYAQCVGYALAVLALLAPRSAARIPLLPAAGSFLLLNAAALLALPASVALDAQGLWRKH